jgi:hypothetical protein
MKIKQYNYIKYVAEDGTEFDTEFMALEHEALLSKIKSIECLLGGKQNQKVVDNEGYYQHTKSNVERAWEMVIELSRPYFEGFDNVFNAKAKDIHPMGIGGRIIDDRGNRALNKLWWRFGCIDSEFKEWNQPYYALNKGTGTNVCVNN